MHSTLMPGHPHPVCKEYPDLKDANLYRKDPYPLCKEYPLAYD